MQGILTLGGCYSGARHQYDLERVLTLGGAAVPVDINMVDLNIDDTDSSPCQVVITDYDPAYKDDGTIIFYKQLGKYTILCGGQTAKKDVSKPNFNNVLHGKLLSTVALKKAKIM